MGKQIRKKKCFNKYGVGNGGCRGKNINGCVLRRMRE